MIAKYGNITEKLRVFAIGAASTYNNLLRNLPFSPHVAVFAKIG